MLLDVAAIVFPENTRLKAHFVRLPRDPKGEENSLETQNTSPKNTMVKKGVSSKGILNQKIRIIQKKRPLLEGGL